MKKALFSLALLLPCAIALGAVGVFNYGVRLNDIDYTGNTTLLPFAPGGLFLNGGFGSSWQNGGDDVCHINLEYSVSGGGPAGSIILNYINDGSNPGDKNFNTTDLSIDISNLPNGNYTLTVHFTIFGRFDGVTCFGNGNEFTTSPLQTILIGFTIDSALPVTLARFEAANKETAIHLSWATSMEQDNHYFAVQRSADGRSFRELGRVAGAGTSALPQEYEWVDRAPLPGWNYYRLRQVDFDGSFEYHPVAAVAFGRAEQPWQVFPNPARGHLYLRGLPLDQGRFTLLNALGQELRAWPAAAAAEGLGIEGLPPGLYHLRWLPAEAVPPQSLPVLIKE
jgi:hypothetical protein